MACEFQTTSSFYHAETTNCVDPVGVIGLKIATKLRGMRDAKFRDMLDLL